MNWHSVYSGLSARECAESVRPENPVNTVCPYLKQVAQLLQKPRELGDFKEVGHFEAKFWVEGLRIGSISMDR